MSDGTKHRKNRGKRTVNFAAAIDNRTVAERVSEALRKAFGDDKSAVKRIGRVALANDRTAENWWAGRNAPNAADLIELMRESDEVLDEVLKLAGRADMIELQRVRDAADILARALEKARGT